MQRNHNIFCNSATSSPLGRTHLCRIKHIVFVHSFNKNNNVSPNPKSTVEQKTLEVSERLVGGGPII